MKPPILKKKLIHAGEPFLMMCAETVFYVFTYMRVVHDRFEKWNKDLPEVRRRLVLLRQWKPTDGMPSVEDFDSLLNYFRFYKTTTLISPWFTQSGWTRRVNKLALLGLPEVPEIGAEIFDAITLHGEIPCYPTEFLEADGDYRLFRNNLKGIAAKFTMDGESYWGHGDDAEDAKADARAQLGKEIQEAVLECKFSYTKTNNE